MCIKCTLTNFVLSLHINSNGPQIRYTHIRCIRNTGIFHISFDLCLLLRLPTYSTHCVVICWASVWYLERLFRLWPIFITFSSECTWCLVRLDERGTFDLHFRSLSARGLTYFFGFFAPEISTNTIAASDLWMVHKFWICVFVSSVEFDWLSWHKIEFWSFGRYIDRVNFCGTMSPVHTDPE